LEVSAAHRVRGDLPTEVRLQLVPPPRDSRDVDRHVPQQRALVRPAGAGAAPERNAHLRGGAERRVTGMPGR
jgi:hypothetical protein